MSSVLGAPEAGNPHDSRVQTFGLVVVPVAVASHVEVPIVDVVDVVAVRNGEVPATFAMKLRVLGVFDV